MNQIRRYPGSRPFTDSPVERMLFRGRDQEKSDLLNLIRAHDLTLLYARSGTGKTSLLNAGILEELRIREFFPVIVRLNSEKPIENMRQTILAEAAELGLQIEDVDKSSQNLVLLLSKTRFWRGDTLLTPVLILDQFEELFTLHEKAAQENIIKALSDLSARRLPDKLEENTATVPTVPFKIVFSVREDYLGEMESVASYIPTIMHHRFRLTPLSREQALKAIREPAAMEIDELCVTAFEYSNEATEELISFLSRQMDRQGYKQGEDIEPFQLQIICQHIEDEVAKRAYEEEGQIVINKNDLGGKEGMDQILEQFYNNQIGQLPEESQEVAHYLCEYGLISPSGKRISLEEDYIDDVYGVDHMTLQKLVELRLIRAEPRVGSTYYELSHDAIVSAIQRTGLERKPALLLQNARTSWDNANYLSAYINYCDLIKCSPNDTVAYSECATMLIDVGRYEEADIVLKEAVKAGVLTEEIHLVLGKLYNAQTDFKAAIEQFEEVLKLNVNSAHAHLGMGLAYFNDYNDPDAAKCFQKALELEPNMQEAHVYFLKAMINMRQFDKVEEYVKNICQKEFFKNILPKLSQELFTQNASRIAENILRDVLDQNENSCDLAATIADAAYAIGDWVTTDLALKVVARLDPERPNYNSWANALQSQGHFSDAEQKYNIAEEKYTIALQNNPNDFYSLLGRAWSRLNLKKYEQAIDDCKNAAEINKRSELPFNYWGRCLYAQNKFHEAFQQFEQALNVKPGDSDLLILWAASLNDMGSFDEAIKKAYEAIKADQTNADAFYELGRSLWLTNRLTEANERFQTAHELDPNRTDILSMWGVLLSTMGNHTVASDKFALANHLNSQDPYILWYWGKTLGDSGCHQAAIDKCRQALTIEPENADAHLYLADNLVAIDNVDEALNHYKEAIKLAPNEPWPHVLLAKTMIKRDNYAEAEEHYRQAAKLAANDEETLILVYDSWGNSLGRKGLHKKAEEIYRKGLEIKTDIGILTCIGSELADQGRPEEARKLFQQAEQLGPKTDYECGGLGWGFYQLGDYDKSLHYSRRCLELRPNALYARCNAGAALIHLGRPEEARKEYELAIETAEQTTDADEFQYHAGDLEQALKDAPDLPGGKKILESLQKHLERIRELRKRSLKVQNTMT